MRNWLSLGVVGGSLSRASKCRRGQIALALTWSVLGCAFEDPGSCPSILITDPIAVEGTVLDSAGDPVRAQSVTAHATSGDSIECDSAYGSFACHGRAGSYDVEVVRDGVVHSQQVRVRKDECGFVRTRQLSFDVGATPSASGGSCPEDRLPLLATLDVSDQANVDSVFRVEVATPASAVVVTRQLQMTERDGAISMSIHASSELEAGTPLRVTVFADMQEAWCPVGPSDLGLGELSMELTPLIGPDPCSYEPVALVFQEADVSSCTGRRD